MILVSNHRKTISRRTLVRENNENNNPMDRMTGANPNPGSSNMPSLRMIPQGVHMPGTVESMIEGDGLVNTLSRTWSSSPGLGQSSVDMPTEKPSPPLFENAIAPALYISGIKRLIDSSSERGYRNSSNTFNSINTEMPGATQMAGSVKYEDTQGSVGRDINREARLREKRLKGLQRRGAR